MARDDPRSTFPFGCSWLSALWKAADAVSTAIRYPAKVLVRARELRDAGWTIARIQDFLEREHGVRPSITTVLVWVDDSFAANRRRTQRRRMRRTHVRRPRLAVSEDWQIDRMRELHEAGFTYREVAVIARIWWGRELEEHQVRYRLGKPS
jgi:hypothetical protein